jgi:hypothetical protein
MHTSHKEGAKVIFLRNAGPPASTKPIVRIAGNTPGTRKFEAESPNPVVQNLRFSGLDQYTGWGRMNIHHSTNIVIPDATKMINADRIKWSGSGCGFKSKCIVD